MLIFHLYIHFVCDQWNVIYRYSLFHFENGLKLNDSYGVFILGIFYDSTGEWRVSTAAVKYCTPYDPFKWIKTIPENDDVDTEGFLEECFGQKHERVVYMHERLMDTAGGKHLFQSDVPLSLQTSAQITRK